MGGDFAQLGAGTMTFAATFRNCRLQNAVVDGDD
jgi:hypothetical protein